MTTKKNIYGEKIHIKIENGTIMVHHEDATDDFIDVNKFLLNITLDYHELSLLYLAIKEEQFKMVAAKASAKKASAKQRLVVARLVSAKQRLVVARLVSAKKASAKKVSAKKASAKKSAAKKVSAAKSVSKKYKK
jgi:hypothetical protein